MASNYLNGTVIEKKGDLVHIEIEGQKLEVSADLVPSKLRAGNIFRIYIMDDGQSEAKDKNIARYILEEILNGK